MSDNEESPKAQKTIAIDEVTASLFQILSQYHCLSNRQLEQFLPLLQQDWLHGQAQSSSSLPALDLKTIFKTMNKKLRLLSFEVKTVAIRSSSSTASSSAQGSSSANATGNSSSNSTNNPKEWEYYHGLVNTEEDVVAKEYGSSFTPLELKFFHLLALRLVMSQQLSTSDILQLKSLDVQAFGKLSANDLHLLLGRLEEELWIQRNERSFYILGPRTFLELQSYLESTVMEGQVIGLEEYTETDRTNAVRALPSLIIY